MQIWYVTENETELESTPIKCWLMASLLKVRARLWGARYLTALLGVIVKKVHFSFYGLTIEGRIIRIN